MKKYLISSVVSLALFSGIQVAQAHSIWVAQRADQMAIVLGEGGMDNRYDADRVKSVYALDANNAPVPLTTINTKNNVLLDLPEQANLVVATYDSGYHSKDAQGKYHKGNKKEVPNAVSTGKYTFITTTLLDHQTKPIILPNLALQVTPLVDPYELQKGDEFKVLVSSFGKPVANAKIVLDYINDPDGPAVMSNNEGIASVKVGSNGVNVLRASHQVNSANTSLADTDNFISTLSFNLLSKEDE
ncbi:DUF4198 domain-containing protein [Psychrobacter sp. I-STPA10]|uniref:DUF4198 domain-containing protein n=1 Tax=Psychrobacter sp. I-STPA10 TaxID=2585769 RepID=UPI001E5C90C6|nr:DUF4198 domain-containing protein [Psychrobacter sp. I-STPA10]